MYELSDTGELTVWREDIIGDSGIGTFTQTGGTHTVNGIYDTGLYIGRGSGSSGTYNLSGGQLSANCDEYVGYEGAGTFTQTGGTNTITSDLHLGYNSGASGTYNLSGGTLSAGNGTSIRVAHYPVPGTYDVTLTMTEPGGVSASSTIQVTASDVTKPPKSAVFSTVATDATCQVDACTDADSNPFTCCVGGGNDGNFCADDTWCPGGDVSHP